MTAAGLSETYALAFPNSRVWSTTEIKALLDDPLCRFYGDTKCFAILRVVAGEGEVLTLATHPDHRRQGLARRVLNKALTDLAKTNVSRVFLEVAADNAAALALYRGADFSQIGVRKGYYMRQNAPAQDAIVMERRLSPDS